MSCFKFLFPKRKLSKDKIQGNIKFQLDETSDHDGPPNNVHSVHCFYM
jgi:hypothetical protein